MACAKLPDVFISAFTLSYTIEPSSLNPIIQFADESITFKCTYPRSIEISDFEFDVDPIQQLNTTDMLGSLSYDLQVNVGAVGERSTLIISTKHGLTNLVATLVLYSSYLIFIILILKIFFRVTECKII